MKFIFLISIIYTLSFGVCPYADCGSDVAEATSELVSDIMSESSTIGSSLSSYEDELKTDKSISTDNYKLLQEIERLSRLRALTVEESAFYLEKIYENLQLKIEHFDINAK